MIHGLYVLAAVSIGALGSLQPAINAAMSRVVGSPFLAAAVSISISMVFITLVWLAGSRGGDLSQVPSLPWWVVFGGVLGVFFVLGGVIVAPTLGMGLFFVCLIAGQLLGSGLADHFGVFGLDVKPLTAVKLVGFGFVIVGAVLVEKGNA